MVRTRFAPSPTGYLHIGGVRTALFNWLFARQHGGQFILRIDDTDQQRNVEEALQPILDGLHWLGIDWDEGPEVGGPLAPYYQSQRLDRYQAAVQRLLASGHAYYDYATTEEIQAERTAAEQEKRQFRYSRRFMAQTDADRARFEAEGRQAVVRLKMPQEGTLVLDDIVRGRVEFDWIREQDHVVQRTDGTCLYHLANVVDDYDLQITHVIRAEEHLSNTPRQVFILEALGYPRPIYAHLPFVAEPGSKNKLSKRKLDKYLKNRDFAQLVEHGRKIAEAIGHAVDADGFNPVIVDFYRTVGYLPEAIVNYMALLGWSLDDKTEHFSTQELIEKFTLERVVKSPASFDPKKLQAFEDWHFQQLSPAQKVELAIPFLVKANLVQDPITADERRIVEKVITAAGDRIKVAGDILAFDDFFRTDDKYPLDHDLLKKHITTHDDAERLCDCRERIRVHETGPDDRNLRRSIAGLVFATSQSTTTTLPPGVDLEEEVSSHAEKIEAGDVDIKASEHSYRDYVTDRAIKMADIIHKARVALTGKAVGLGLFDTIAVLGKGRSLARIDRALREAGFPELALPQAIGEVVDLSNVETRVTLYKGQIAIRKQDESAAGEGTLEFSLKPQPRIGFSVHPTSGNPWSVSGEALLQIPELDVSVDAIVTRCHMTSAPGGSVLEGVPNGQIVIGSGKCVSGMIFHVTGFHDYVGKGIRNEARTHFWSGRLNLAAGEWVITIDSVSDLTERRRQATKYGGVPVTHTGKLERQDGKLFTGSHCSEILSLLQCFLSFVCGRWVAPLIATGFDPQGNRVWQDCTLWRTTDVPSFGSWCAVQDMNFVEKFFPRFYERWMNPDWREFLQPVISSYLQGNKQGLLDDSIIFSQIALEMIADFVLVEQTRAYPAVATEAAAADRIGRLFQYASIPTEIPDQFAGLRRFAETEHLSSGLDTIMRVRNACVHHNLSNRQFLRRLDSERHRFFDASRLALWYTDLCLLWLLGYDGRYRSRVHAKWAWETEPVPWEKPLEYPLVNPANAP